MTTPQETPMTPETYTVTYSREGDRPVVLATAASLAEARAAARKHGATKRDRAWTGREECWAVRGRPDAGIWIEATR